MVEVLEFIFGGTVLWGTVRYAGVCFLLLLVLCAVFAMAKGIRK